MSTKAIHSAAQTLGRLGGLAKSKAKAEAVRENGKLGGRPVGTKDSKPRKQRIKRGVAVTVMDMFPGAVMTGVHRIK